MRRPESIPICLRDLRLHEEFEWRRMAGVVMDCGYVLRRQAHTPRLAHVKAMLVRFGTVELILDAEAEVLVPFNRAHARFDPALEAVRWATRLREPEREPAERTVPVVGS